MQGPRANFDSLCLLAPPLTTRCEDEEEGFADPSLLWELNRLGTVNPERISRPSPRNAPRLTLGFAISYSINAQGRPLLAVSSRFRCAGPFWAAPPLAPPLLLVDTLSTCMLATHSL